MRVRLADVASLAGVHPATASRALNERTRSKIGAETVRRVLQAAEELSYSPNPAAQSLALNRSSSIGVIIGDLTVPLFPPVILGVDDATSSAGYTALIVNTDNVADRERARIRTLAARNVDGLIVATSTIDSDHRDYTSVAPTVFVVRTPSSPLVSSVISDEAVGIHGLVEHLTDLGHERIAHIAGPRDISTSTARLRAYREALFERQIDYDPALVIAVDSLRLDESARRCRELLDRDSGLTAIVAFNDLVAFGAYQALRERKLRIPDDVSVTGFNDMTGADLVAPGLTTVAVDHYDMGVTAARLMLDMLAAPEKASPRSIRLPVTLVVRHSTGPPPN